MSTVKVKEDKTGLKENYITIYPEKCTGCNACVYACALKHSGDVDPALSRITIIRPEGEEKSYIPINCAQCAEPACVEVCPNYAITRNEDGTVTINDERCVGCLLCTIACPYAGALFDKQADKPMTCDLCDGMPECVRLCPEEALTFKGAKSIRREVEESRDLWSKGIPACLGCSMELTLRFIMRILGPNTILYVPPGCEAACISGMSELPSAEIPAMMGFLTNTASFLTGVWRHYKRTGRKVNIVAYAGDGGTADVGFQCLSGAAERNEKIIYVCNDNEGYMNTGVQRSGTTSYGAWTTTTPVGDVGKGKKEASKEMAWIMLAHGVPYVATATTGFLSDLEYKVKKAAQVDGFSYIHLLNPCPTGWRFPPEKILEVSRMAVKTNYFPLWEAENGKMRQTVKIRKPLPIGEYTKLIGKYRHLDKEQLHELQMQVDHRYKRLHSVIGLESFP